MDRFSISKIIQYLTCPRSFYHIYILGFQLKKSDNMFFGSSLHEGLAAFYRGEDPIKKFVHFTKSQTWQKPKDYNDDKYIPDGIKILEAYKKEGTYFDPNPDWIERKELIKFSNPITGEKIETPFSFTIDLITKDKYILDWKTSSSSKGDQNETNRIQGIAYQMAFFSIFGERPKGFIQYTIAKLKTPKFIPRVFHYTEDDELYVFNLVKHVLGRVAQRGYLVDKPTIKTFYPCAVSTLCDIHRKKL